uniref:WGS project CBMF000000000 data, contig CS5834_c000143 n=1 Tax=Fusarium pseudograminearum CS5834 TaxID=1318459 RepID=A0A096PE91_FUSPS|nr:unnamed protein product [Fusarium pseudograminearum CS5834]
MSVAIAVTTFGSAPAQNGLIRTSSVATLNVITIGTTTPGLQGALTARLVARNAKPVFAKTAQSGRLRSPDRTFAKIPPVEKVVNWFDVRMTVAGVWPVTITSADMAWRNRKLSQNSCGNVPILLATATAQTILRRSNIVLMASSGAPDAVSI